MDKKILLKLINLTLKKKFERCEKKVNFGSNVKRYLRNVSIGNNCSIGSNTFFDSYNAKVFIDNFVMISQDVLLITGNHGYDIIGKSIILVTNDEKKKDNDLNFIFNDVCIGSRSIILKDVHINKGAIIGA